MVPRDKDKTFPSKKLSLEKATRKELRRKKLCFFCKDLWEPGHICLRKGKIHYIEVVFDDEDDQENLPPEGNHTHDSKMVSFNLLEKIVGTTWRNHCPRRNLDVWSSRYGEPLTDRGSL